MQRIYHPVEYDDELIIDDKQIIHQIIKVLRSVPGDSFIFFDEKKDVQYKLVEIFSKKLIFQKEVVIEKNYSWDKNIVLYQSLPNKIEKIEIILQKCTEIGVGKFIFFKAERSQKLHISEKKLDRFHKIVVEAIEQSGQNIIPEIQFLEAIDYDNIVDDTNIYFHTKSKQSKSLKQVNYSKNINIFVGPEGGFTEDEIRNFDKNNFKKVYLGENILRTETCAIGVSFYLSQIL